MKFRALDLNGDWTFGRGLQNYAEAQNAIALNIQTNVMFFLNDCFFDAGKGIDWFNLLGSKNEAALLFSIKSTILNTEGVNSVTQLGAEVSDRHLSVNYSVTTVYGIPYSGQFVLPIVPFTGINKFSGDIYFDGVEVQQDIDVSSLLADATKAIWQLYDIQNSYSPILGAVQPLSATTVRLSADPALPAGFYRLIGIA